MIRRILIHTLLFFTGTFTVPASALAVSIFPAPIFDEVKSVEAALSLVTAAVGNEQFESECRKFLKKYKFDLTRPFIAMDFDGRKIRFDDLAAPISIGVSPSEFTYKKVTFTYNPEKSVQTNFNRMQKAWGHFKELKLSPIMNHNSLTSLNPSGAMLFTAVGITAALGDDGYVVSSYFGYKWYKNNTDPLKVECGPTKIIQSKGKDRLVIELMADGKQSFYSEIGGKRELQGELQKISLRGKDSYSIAHGNTVVDELRTSSAVELRRNLMAMESLCSDPSELESFNISSRHIQDAIKTGKVKLIGTMRLPAQIKEEVVSGGM